MGTSWEAVFPSFAGALNFSIPRARNMRFIYSRICICIAPLFVVVCGRFYTRDSSLRGNKQNIIEKRTK